MHKDKAELRRTYRARRNALSTAEREAAQDAIVDNLARIIADEKRSRVAIYLAVHTEANIDELLRVLTRRSAIVAAPANYDLPPLFKMLRVQDEIVSDERGARFPPEHARIVSPSAFDMMLVPGIAFDESGNRLGQGGGWYDRTFVQTPHALKIGVAFECQIARQLPHEPHDVVMDIIVTETRIITAQSAARQLE